MAKVRQAIFRIETRATRAPVFHAVLVLAALLVTQFPTVLHAQGAPDMTALADSARARMQPLRWLIGEWSGPATTTMGGHSMNVTQGEKVIEGANGTVLIIQGRGTIGDRTVFEAAGLLTYDMASRQYKLASSGGAGFLGVTEAQVKGDTIIWYAPSGRNSRMRYTAWRTAKGEWREVGDVSEDNQTWTRTMEMTLVKK